jgi:phage shock protein PspC (stress-responsive transcriptional regulator)
MKRVITASLNRNAFQFEEDAYARLEGWLADASARLQGDPDRAEILADLEQSVADKCSRRLPTGRTVITLDELVPTLQEIGHVEAVESASSVTAVAAGASAEHGATAGGAAPSASIALQQISQGAWISGVCLGLARSASIDATFVRVITLLLLFVTGGGLILLYGVLMVIMPFAPIDPAQPPMKALPAKCRAVIVYLRSKLSALSS